MPYVAKCKAAIEGTGICSDDPSIGPTFLKILSPYHPANEWIHNHVGIDPVIMGILWVFVLIALYFLFLKLLVEIAFYAKVEYEYSRGPVAILWWIVAYAFVAVLMLFNLIHLLLTLGAAYSALHGFREWWHAGRK